MWLYKHNGSFPAADFFNGFWKVVKVTENDSLTLIIFAPALELNIDTSMSLCS